MRAIWTKRDGPAYCKTCADEEPPTKEEALTQLMAFKAKYGKRYPEAVRSLAEEEEKTFTFYAFLPSMHRHIQTTYAIESLAEQCAAAD